MNFSFWKVLPSWSGDLFPVKGLNQEWKAPGVERAWAFESDVFRFKSWLSCLLPVWLWISYLTYLSFSFHNSKVETIKHCLTGCCMDQLASCRSSMSLVHSRLLAKVAPFPCLDPFCIHCGRTALGRSWRSDLWRVLGQSQDSSDSFYRSPRQFWELGTVSSKAKGSALKNTAWGPSPGGPFAKWSFHPSHCPHVLMEEKEWGGWILF